MKGYINFLKKFNKKKFLILKKKKKKIYFSQKIPLQSKTIVLYS